MRHNINSTLNHSPQKPESSHLREGKDRVWGRFGGYSKGETRDPIPNSAVKPLRAYDTMT
jgi:hypothetical protein